MKKGFTILELLVVISVLVILIGIAIPRFKGMQDAGRLAQARAELQTLQTAVESYYINSSGTKAYPPDASSATVGATNLVGATPQIISSVLYDPMVAGGATEYLYHLSGAYYVISSAGTGTSASSTIASTGVATKGTGNLCVTNGTGC